MVITKKIGSELIFERNDDKKAKFDFKTNKIYKEEKGKWEE